jgi:hypothetical protein
VMTVDVEPHRPKADGLIPLTAGWVRELSFLLGVPPEASTGSGYESFYVKLKRVDETDVRPAQNCGLESSPGKALVPLGLGTGECTLRLVASHKSFLNFHWSAMTMVK